MIENDIKKLIKILEKSNIDELEVSTFWGKQNIRIKKESLRDSDAIQYIPEKSKKIDQPIPPPEVSDLPLDSVMPDNDANGDINDAISKDTLAIKAPLVGTFYSSPKPGAAPFVAIGETIKEGQVICIVEAMKIFNEIESEYTGKVLEILVKDGTPVEFDQPLLLISSN